ncbi:MAG: dihydrolipoamide dehydrogenase [Myxococcota bacterium]|jgi:dihydrolipoamide dehydrogenase
MPSKLLIAAAEAAHHVHQAPMFGVNAAPPEIDGPAVMRRVQSERDRFVCFVGESIDAIDEAGELIRERATVMGPGHLVAGDHDVHFRTLVVATGTVPFTPPPFRGLGDALLTNDGIFELADLPESLLVVGLGVIGLELGQAFHRLGVRTTLVGVGGTVGPLSDPEVTRSAIEVLGAELDMHPDYTLNSIESVDGGVCLDFVDSAGVHRVETYERVLMAAGRSTTLGKLGLETLGVEPVGRNDWGIHADTLQLQDAAVFIAGDVNGLHPLLHEASDDGKVAGANAATFPNVVSTARRTSLAVVFSDPQIGIVGTAYSGLKSCSGVVGEVDYSDQGRARVAGMNAGLVRIYADLSGVLIGAELFGPRVEHLSHLLAWAVQQKLTVEQALAMPFYHPVVEEGIRTALRDLLTNLQRGQKVKCTQQPELVPGC